MEMTKEERQRRTFSESFKRKKVIEIESKQSRVSDICREYSVSEHSVYNWLHKYGHMGNKKERLIVESESDTKKLQELQRRVAELERLLGQKQILLDFKDEMIEIAEEMYNVDIKKKCGELLSSNTKKNV